jgi:hypothetical protein
LDTKSDNSVCISNQKSLANKAFCRKTQTSAIKKMSNVSLSDTGVQDALSIPDLTNNKDVQADDKTHTVPHGTVMQNPEGWLEYAKAVTETVKDVLGIKKKLKWKWTHENGESSAKTLTVIADVNTVNRVMSQAVTGWKLCVQIILV